MFDKDNITPEREADAKQNARRVFLICAAISAPIMLWFLYQTFTAGNLSGHGKFALILAVVFSLLTALLFMGIIFFSSRSGHDEQPNYREIVEAARGQKRPR